MSDESRPDDAAGEDATGGSEDDDPAEYWDDAYDRDDPAPWDTDEPQPAFVDLAADRSLGGRVLDAGCGTGTHAVWAAERGRSATGIDVSEAGIERARRATADCEGETAFRVANALDLPADVGPFDTVLDSGLFHAFGPDQRGTYADELAGVVASGGEVWLVGFREGAPDDWGPTPFSRTDVREAFAGGEWTVSDLRDADFETREATVPGLLAVVERA